MRPALLLLLVAFCHSAIKSQVRNFEAVNFSKVNITDQFWKPKMDKVATVTMDACIYQTEVRTARIRNFEKVIRKKGERHEGIYYDDSDVYKALEAMAYSIHTRPNAKLEAKADEWIDKIAAAQEQDGYLNTYYSLRGLENRWTDVEKHEDYNAGHLIEAAVAYYDVTGKRKFLDVAIRLANHIDSVLHLSGKKWISGHQEIELALVKLHRVTQDERYLKLAKWYVDSRGYKFPYNNGWITPAYWQDIKPVVDQTEISGHAVRAMYMFSGVTDLAKLQKNNAYLSAMEKIWEDVVYRNMYVTGGIGSAGDNEGFSVDYDLPNEEAYCETCASVGMVFWNARMGQVTGNSKYYDVLERSLYNGALDGISLSGDRFFYDNPLASNGKHTRKAWFGTACCPANIARMVASLGNYVYGQSKDGIWINLYVGSNASFTINNKPVSIETNTQFPWDGKVQVKITEAPKEKFAMYFRVPDWFTGNLADGKLYSPLPKPGSPRLGPVAIVNGKEATGQIKDGYLVIENKWKKGDEIVLDFDMKPFLIQSNPLIKANIDRLAIQRGPLMYCVEGADNPAGVWNLIMDPNAEWTSKPLQILGEHVVALTADLKEAVPSPDGLSVQLRSRMVTAIPYYSWANRQANDMQVWLPVRIHSVMINNENKKSDGGNF